MKEIEQIIFAFKPFENIPIDELMYGTNTSSKNSTKPTNKKIQSFPEAVELLFSKRYNDINGIKVNYQKMNCSKNVEAYFDETVKSKVIKETTSLDLRLLYCLLIEDKNEIKGNKNEVYEIIKNNIRARKRGEAFGKL
jgi:hypothetical protein